MQEMEFTDFTTIEVGDTSDVEVTRSGSYSVSVTALDRSHGVVFEE